MKPITISPSSLKRLNVRDRNRVRSILALRDDGNAFELLNKLRGRLPWQELVQVERALRSSTSSIALPELFPCEPQTEERFNRLRTPSAEVQLKVLNALIVENKETLSAFCAHLHKLNAAIVEKDIRRADNLISRLSQEFGYSHLGLRKAALVKSFCGDAATPQCDRVLEAAGLARNNVVCASLVHCYQEEPDYLTLKRSILNLAKQGAANRFTRDISRLPFHAHAKDVTDFESLLQSSMQSSLIDACILVKINREQISTWLSLESETIALMDGLAAASPSLEEISDMYAALEVAEELFVKQASAWYECAEIVEARFAIDHFYDAPESPYLDLTETVVTRAGRWLRNVPVADLSGESRLTFHECDMLAAIEREGDYTRSSAFNYRLRCSEGFEPVEEKSLFELMGCTRDLARTSYVPHLRNLANSNNSEWVKLIAYLLVAKRSRNERDDHRLRNILQNITITQFGGDLTKLLTSLSARSSAVADYAYDLCTEDFIAKLSRITESAAQITETRALLHVWMYEKTKRKAYLDRARTLRIDQQINRVRNEIDDNRIYVDAGRLSEWISDELVAELNALFGSLQKNIQVGKVDATQLTNLIARCYATFCQNQVFGMASYLGRRIRHGTFKGHLFYSTASALEARQEFELLRDDPTFELKWSMWKRQFESTIDNIILERLHVESASKKNGFLRTSIEVPDKYEIAIQCARYIMEGFLENNNTDTAAPVLIDYCWRLAEVDLKAFNIWLRHQKSSLLNQQQLDDLKASAPPRLKGAALSFHREIVSCVQEKLNAMSTWFKRPPSVSPKASLSLLFRAVVAEVKETFPDFEPILDDTGDEIELLGGVYHVIYDSFYVAVFNAAKHGKVGGLVTRKFYLEEGQLNRKIVVCEIASELRDSDSEAEVRKRLEVAPNEAGDIENAQLYEGRSGIRKLHHLAIANDRFSIRMIAVVDRKVNVAFAYELH